MTTHSQCKIYGCENLSSSERGMYARLCEDHKAERIASNISDGNKKASPFPKTAQVAARLVDICERIDSSAEDFRKSRNQLKVDVKHLNSILDELKRTVQTIVSD